MYWHTSTPKTPCGTKEEAAELWDQYQASMLATSEDETWFVVEHEFLESLQLLATYGTTDDPRQPGLSATELPLKIKNRPLLCEESRGKPRATKLTFLDDAVAYAQGERFDLVNEAFWRQLMRHFEADIEIPRRVYRDGQRLKVEAQPLSLGVYTAEASESQGVSFTRTGALIFSRGDALEDVRKKVLAFVEDERLTVLQGFAAPAGGQPSQLQPLHPGAAGGLAQNLAEAGVESDTVLVALAPTLVASLVRGSTAAEKPEKRRPQGLPWDGASSGRVSAGETSPQSPQLLQVQGDDVEEGSRPLKSDGGAPQTRFAPGLVDPQLPEEGGRELDARRSEGALCGLEDRSEESDEARERSSSKAWLRGRAGERLSHDDGSGSEAGDAGEADEAPQRDLREVFATGGVCGLANLGNTCFLNSAVQCLSKVLPLSYYFLSGQFVKDINEENVMGTGGRLARAYYATLRDMWFGRESPLAPRDLKWAVGRVREEFHGYNQQDSQELIAFLLDGLHEDLNRIKKKPYYESKIEGGPEMSDAEVAEASWRRHKEINDSAIVDLFQGQYRSRLQCPECGRVSVTFDPFMYLSLPVPPEWKHQVHFTLASSRRAEGFRFEQACAGPLDYGKAKEIFLDIVSKLLAEDDAKLDFDERDAFRQEVLASTQLKETSQLSANNVLMFAKAADDLLGVYHLEVNIKVFTADDLVKYRFDRKPSHIFAWLMPAKIVQEVEAGCRREFGRDSLAGAAEASDESMNGDACSAASAEGNGPAALSDGAETEDSWKGLASYSSDGSRASSPERSPHRVKKRRSNSFSLGARGLAETGTFFTFVLPVVRTPSGDVRPLYRRMPVMLPVSVGATCEELYKQVEAAYLASSEEPEERVEDGESPQGKSLINHAVGFIRSFSGQLEQGSRPIRLLVPAGFGGREAQKSVISQGVNLLTNGIGGKAGQPKPLPEDAQLVVTNLQPKAGDFVALLYADMGSLADSEKPGVAEGIRPMGCVAVQPDTDISDCLRMFAEQERLDADNMWYCSSCKDHVQAYKKLDLWKMPKILILHLKRFHNISRFTRSKIGTRVTFPYKTGDYLDMTPYILPKSLELTRTTDQGFAPLYELVAVNVHSGELGGGHYFAYAKLRGRWYDFNDSWVQPVSEDACHSSDAYMLFYRLKQDEDEWASQAVPHEGAGTMTLSGEAPALRPSTTVGVNNHLVC
ncbi:hypothetical protein BESB_000700 [Besnoitia besnoiti]|uniref:USP domain-containing protein n=1 Tax=Besnoitia besnoiti TaxID=94643 RepID=A0A2A9MGS7_BESBE|nr:hypothetical protein BESB_000700 [Besnoitia besnoiti]PFH37728.1 hypothetical protein BESB_000700 [Besnoitia besnoiti]